MKHIRITYILLINALVVVALIIAFFLQRSHVDSDIKYIVTTRDTYDYIKGFEIKDMTVTNENDVYVMFFPYGILKADDCAYS